MDSNKFYSNISVLVSGYSHFGKAKTRYYEDRIKYGEVTNQRGLSFVLSAVADGVESENAGEHAATLVVDGVFQYCSDSMDVDIPTMLTMALKLANRKIFREAQKQNQKKGMCSTAIIAAIHDDRLFLVNVGDSRAYHIRGNTVNQLTIDHVWANRYIFAGKLSPKEAYRHPRAEELVRAIGYEANVQVDIGLYVKGIDTGIDEAETLGAQGLLLQRDDFVLLCSDGLIKPKPFGGGHFVETKEIVNILRKVPHEEASQQLIQKALDRNVDDNVSVIVMKMV